ncbi:MAG TPA: DegV family protein [Clostridiales bacterium]|nr:DegV family protein [Clostridiales bacterium]
MAIRIITDSTSDISFAQAKTMGVTLVPLKVIFGDTEYREGIEITIDEFYKKLVEADKLPTTSQPSPDDFLKYFQEAKEAGDSVIVILISSKLSGTVQSALIAKDMVGYPDIHIVDSKNTITGLRTLVEIAVQMRDMGKGCIEIINQLNDLKERIVLLAMMDTLDYLYKGGRLSKTSTILGSLLKFKPIITLKDGSIEVVGKERGVNKGIAKIMDSIGDFGEIDLNYPINLGYTAENSKSLILMERLMDKYQLSDLPMHSVGCVVGTHAGPGACVLTYIRKK